MIKQTFPPIFLFLSLILIPLNAHASCEIDVVSDPIYFGNRTLGYYTDEFSITIENIGDQRAIVDMNAGNWKNSTNHKIMNKENTHWSLTPGQDYDDMTETQSNHQQITSLKKHNQLEIFFQVLLSWSPQGTGYYGNVTQTLTFGGQCN